MHPTLRLPPRTRHRRAGAARAGATVFLAAATLGAAHGAAEAGRSVRFLPEERIYESYLADPWMHGFSINLIHVSNVGIDKAGNLRQGLKLGGSFGVLRIHEPGAFERGWQFSIETGFNGQVDLDKGWDVVGWDGIAGLLVTKRLSHNLSIRLSPYMHRSSHIGDEHIERTGRTRIEYTREEYTAGISWNFLDDFRVYGDAGYAFTTRSRLQEVWRTQAGVEWVDHDRLRPGKAGLYAALNATSFQETDWHLDLSLAAGFIFPRRDRDWRLGILAHHGSVPLGEFFFEEETFVSAGAWLDF